MRRSGHPVGVVLAAGRGSRLGSLTQSAPKPLLPVGTVPLLERAARQLCANGAGRVLVNAFHHAEHVARWADGALGLPIEVRLEDALRGPAGSLLTFHSELRTEDAFWVVSGDAVTDLPFNRLLSQHRASGAAMTVVAKAVDDAEPFDVLAVDDDDVLVGFRRRPHGFASALVSCGIYAVSGSCLGHIPPDTTFDFADLFDALRSSGDQVRVFPHNGYWKDIGAPRALWEANLDWLCGLTDVGGVARSVHIAADARVEPSAVFRGRVLISPGADVGECCELEDVVVLPDAPVKPHERRTSALISPGETWVFDRR
jgi:NDP-sugar pyrophosphorylase family protein